MTNTEDSKENLESTKKSQWSWIGVDVGNSAFATTILVAVFPVYLNQILNEREFGLSLWGWQWKTNALSLWGYTVSFSIFLSLIIILFLGSWADEHRKRKFFLVLFNLLGAIATMSLGFFEHWQSLLIAFVIANMGFSLGNVFNNSLLSSVAKEDEWDKLSLKGYAWGYVAGGFVLALNLGMIMKPGWLGLASAQQGVQLSFITAGLWWFAMSLPAAFFIHELPSTEPSGFGRISVLLKTLRSLLKQKTLLLFIVAYALLNDGVWTVVTMSSVFAKQTLSLDQNFIITTFLIIQFVGWPATLFMISASKKFGTKRTLQASLVLWIALLIYAFGIESGTDFMILGLGVAVVLGVTQALPRSIYVGLIPRRQQAEYFAVYALSGKAASIAGPAFFALMMDLTQSARVSIVSLAIFFASGFAILSALDLKKKPARSFD